MKLSNSNNSKLFIGLLAGMAIGFLASIINTENDLKPLQPKNTISYERAYNLQQEYIKTRARFLNEHLYNVNHFEQKHKKGLTEKENDTISDVIDVTFSLDNLKAYIDYVEVEAKKNDLKGLGMRVYLGAYPKNDSLTEDSGFTTVFFMPTHQPEPMSNNANNFFYWNEDEVIQNIKGLNFGSGSHPPRYLIK